MLDRDFQRTFETKTTPAVRRAPSRPITRSASHMGMSYLSWTIPTWPTLIDTLFKYHNLAMKPLLLRQIQCLSSNWHQVTQLTQLTSIDNTSINTTRQWSFLGQVNKQQLTSQLLHMTTWLNWDNYIKWFGNYTLSASYVNWAHPTNLHQWPAWQTTLNSKLNMKHPLPWQFFTLLLQHCSPCTGISIHFV